MSKKVLSTIFIAAGVVALGLLLLYAEPKAGENVESKNISSNQTSQLTADLSAYDFGTISMKNGKVTKSFKVYNNQNSPVLVTKVYTSCMCTDALLKIDSKLYGPFGMLAHGAAPSVNQEIKPNQEASIDVTFDPNAHGPAGVGVIEREVTVEQASGGKLTLNIKANVTP